MKYTDSKSGINFNDVKQHGVYHASGPIGLNGLHEVNGNTLSSINSNLSLINAVDIDWNSALVDSGVELKTTGDLLRWIKNNQGGSGGSGGNVELTINSEGYWCINGTSTGVKARGENGITPHIGTNGNWFIGTTDTGVKASGGLNISYINSIGTTGEGVYLLGTLLIGNNPIEITGVNTSGTNTNEVTNIVNNILNNNVRYSSSITSGTRLGTLYVGSNDYPIIGSTGSSSTPIIPSITADANVDSSTGTPSVSVTRTGTDSNPKFTFNFSGLKGEPGSGGGGTSYDDTELRNRVTSAESSLSTLRSTVLGIKNWTTTEINNLISDGLSHYNFLSNLTPDLIFNISGWDDKLKLYIQTIAFNEGNNSYTISQIILKLGTIEGLVENIRIIDDLGGVITLELLTSVVSQRIELDTNTAIGELTAAFNTFKSDNGEFGILKSNYASFVATVNPELTSIRAIAESKVSSNTLNEAIAGLASETYVNNKVSSATASLVSNATMLSYVSGQIENATSGFITSAQVDSKISSAKATMLADIDDTYAKIEATVTKYKDENNNYYLDSNVNIKADNIVLDGNTSIKGYDSNINQETGTKDQIMKLSRQTLWFVGDSATTRTAGYTTEIRPNSIEMRDFNDLTYFNISAVKVVKEIINGIEIYKNNGSATFNVPVLLNDGLSIGGNLTFGNNLTINNDNIIVGDAKIKYDSGKLNIDKPIITNNKDIYLGIGGKLRFEDNNGSNNYILYDSSLGEIRINTGAYVAGDLDVNGDINATGEIISSDERLKENIIPVNVNISDIAKTRIVDFNFKNQNNKTLLGSIAQDWLDIFPSAVREGKNGYLAMNYSSIALGSAVTAAREIVALKEENQLLKDRLAAIEQKLEAINNALG